MAKTISGNYSSGITLSNPSDNPATVTGTISLASAGIDLQAASVWSVFNSGSIIGPNTTSSYGVSLGDGGYVANEIDGTIQSYFGVDISGAGGTVVNAGRISAGGTATIASGVYLRAGGSVSNEAAASIKGDQTGIRVAGAAGSVTNDGSIAGAAYDGIYMLAGGYVSNAASASITGGYVGVVTSLGSGGTVLNAGYIAGLSKDGVVLQHGGSVSNAASGLIKGLGDEGVFLYNGGTFTNAGTVIGYNGGADMLRGASVSNASGGLITSGRYGVFMRYGTGTAVNAGIIEGNTADAVMLYSGGSVTNSTGGTIQGHNGIVVLGTSGLVVNYGLISGYNDRGISLEGGGGLTNKAGGTINGVNFALVVDGADGTVTNSGIILSSIAIDTSGTIVNLASGTITGNGSETYTIRFANNYGTVVNSGLITGTTTGVIVSLGDSGGLTNEASGTISGGNTAVFAQYNHATLINYGTIAAAAGGTAVSFTRVTSSLVKVGPKAVFSGTVDGGSSISGTTVPVLELAAGDGTILGVGSSFINFGSIEFDSGAAWLVSGSPAALAGGQTIGGFAKGNTIAITGVTDSIDIYSSGTLSLKGSMPLHLLLPGSFTTADFAASNPGSKTDIVIACFAAGTRILTDRGEIEVERLQPGMRVVSLTHRRLLPLKWIGSQRIDCGACSRPMLVWPVCIAAGAFAPGVPMRNLFLSPDHAVFVGGVLVPVRHLLNGASVAQVPCDHIRYFHIELPGHAVLLAEGLPAESYLDTGNRVAFTTIRAATDDPANRRQRSSAG